MSFILSLFGCAAVLITSLTFIKPIISFFDEVKILGKLDSDILSVILKTVGIGMLGEISATICTDAGNAALGKAVQMMANAMMLWLSIPLFRNLLEMVQDMLVRI